MRIAMAAPVPLREEYDAAELRRLARSTSDPGQVRRLLALAAIYAGAPRSAAAAVGGGGLQSGEEGPIPAVHGGVRWRIVDLIQWVWDEFRLSISKQTMSRELRALGFRKLSARPRHHAKDEDAEMTFKKTFPRAWRRSPRARLRASL